MKGSVPCRADHCGHDRGLHFIRSGWCLQPTCGCMSFKGAVRTETDITRDLFMAALGGLASAFLAHEATRWTAPPPLGRRRRRPAERVVPGFRADSPRAVLGLPLEGPLTVAAVQLARRELAKLHHPDRGGDTRAMQRVNIAADALLVELGAKPRRQRR